MTLEGKKKKTLPLSQKDEHAGLKISFVGAEYDNLHTGTLSPFQSLLSGAESFQSSALTCR